MFDQSETAALFARHKYWKVTLRVTLIAWLLRSVLFGLNVKLILTCELGQIRLDELLVCRLC